MTGATFGFMPGKRRNRTIAFSSWEVRFEEFVKG